MDAEAVRAPSLPLDSRNRRLALIALCVGVLMIVLDTTIVNVALPSIRSDLGLTETSLVWIVNAYLVTFGGSLILGGRLGDILGLRRVFMFGVLLFTAASLVCGLATGKAILIAARSVQGFGAAIVLAVAVSLITRMFPEGTERARAMGLYGFVSAGGAAIGVLLGGVITSTLGWHWIFLVNIPVGGIVYAMCRATLPADTSRVMGQKLDVWGAATVTASLMVATYAIVDDTDGDDHSLLIYAAALLGVFVIIEAHIRDPLMPLRIFRQRNVTISSVVYALWSAGTYSWLLLSALYMQLVLGLKPMQIGLVFFPMNVIIAASSLALSPMLIARFGIRIPLGAGMLLGALGLAVFSTDSAEPDALARVLSSMVLVGLGVGIALNPLTLAAMSVAPSESGLASGIMNTSSRMGSAVGVAIFASAAAVRTHKLLDSGATCIDALAGGYRFVFLLAACSAGIAALLGTALLRTQPIPPERSSGVT